MYPICLYVGEDPGLEKQNRLAHKCQQQLRDINEISGAEISIMFVGHDPPSHYYRSVSESHGSRFRSPSPTTLAHPLGIGPQSRLRGIPGGRRQTFREEKVQK